MEKQAIKSTRFTTGIYVTNVVVNDKAQVFISRDENKQTLWNITYIHGGFQSKKKAEIYLQQFMDKGGLLETESGNKILATFKQKRNVKPQERNL